MNVGKKIRSLRVSKLMTQSELAGTHITRNMLSYIENGSAQPSLSTLVYLAGRLNVPVGFLLAEEGDEILYEKMNGLANVKQAFRQGDYAGCRALCRSSFAEPDDEIKLMLAECDVEIAVEQFWQGRLRYACQMFDEALRYASETVYRMPHITATAEVYFRFMERISPTLYSENLDTPDDPAPLPDTPFCAYVNALDALENGNAQPAKDYGTKFEKQSFFGQHLQIRVFMTQESYKAAKDALQSLLRAEEPLNEVGLYLVLCDLETCCRETEDFKGAYQYTNEKVQVLEQLLRE